MSLRQKGAAYLSKEVLSLIYADHAATSPLDPEAFEKMKPFMVEAFGNASQPYGFSKGVKKALQEAREQVAACIHAHPEEIFFTSGGSESDNWAIKGVLDPGDKRQIITSSFEHHAILHSCQTAARFGFPVVYLMPETDGHIRVPALEKALAVKTKLVSIMMSNNELGTIQPIKELCEAAHGHGALFHTDAVQSMGHIPIDVEALGVDMLSASSHKFNGPKGIGFLYIRKGTPLHVYMDGGSQEWGMRAGTENVAAIVGMATALWNNCQNLKVNQKHLKALEQIILTKLNASGIDYLRNGTAPQVPGNMSLSFKGKEGEMLLHRLDLKGIEVSTGSACNSEKTEISYVLQSIHLEEAYGLGTIRVSLGHENTEEEAEAIADALIQICQGQ